MSMSPRLLRPRATGFNPKSISGLAIWLDASDATTISTATGVSEWRTKVAGSLIAATQSVANNQPAYQTAQKNGKNSIYFDGTNDSLTMGNLSATFPTGASACVAYTADSDTEYAVINTGSNNQFWAYPTGRTYIGTFKTTRLENLASASMPTASSAVVSVTSGSSAYNVYINNAVAHTAAADFAAGTLHQIALNNLGTYFKGWVHEIIYYSRAISASEQSNVFLYLKSKWAI